MYFCCKLDVAECKEPFLLYLKTEFFNAKELDIFVNIETYVCLIF